MNDPYISMIGEVTQVSGLMQKLLEIPKGIIYSLFSEVKAVFKICK